ncbi:MAG: hypothetical protein C0473_02700 [Cyanobacteria bacterium DS3.002]|nr:hypothetical protein [Cyanobacteria bacterium DS3.002]MBA4049725.1 hypothetical protein [Cyanobacteria bacterium DS2.008]MBA4073388.1 hypothetical protein [Cyanobacteria bacterium PR.023]
MQKKYRVLYDRYLLLYSWLLPPWQQASNNGTGNNITSYTFRGYHPAWKAPAVDPSRKITKDGQD